ncbi:hypothetical protein MesoLj131c_62470 [Mesorhizobium sp. 131-3-5]|nr:hypothetical protein MesoLj131c_62470 [Mesorhizobium sp. 131-3-5]
MAAAEAIAITDARNSFLIATSQRSLQPRNSRRSRMFPIANILCEPSATNLLAKTFAEADLPMEVPRKVIPPHPNSVRQECML